MQRCRRARSASHGTFADAAAFGEVIWNCTNGVESLEALRAAGADNLRGKVLIDVTNPLDTSKGMPPSLPVCKTDSVGEQLQRVFPDTQVVKTLNTINCGVMVNSGKVAGADHTVFLSGNDPSAKTWVREILSGWFGWKHLLDLGNITTARGAEAYVLLWVRLWGPSRRRLQREGRPLSGGRARRPRKGASARGGSEACSFFAERCRPSAEIHVGGGRAPGRTPGSSEKCERRPHGRRCVTSVAAEA
jgi:predicted dinucleotide-binding enzyme